MRDGLRSLVRLSAALATRRPEAVAAAMEEAEERAVPGEVEEALLQSYLFLGYPAALNALGLWRGRSGHRAGPPAEDAHLWRERGAEVCAAVYGGQYEGLRANVRRLHPDMERWMVEEGYGKVLGRPGLGLRDRELCIVALLAVLDTPRQLHSHLRGALNVGTPPREVAEALDTALELAAPGAAARARDTWAAVRDRWHRKQEG